MERDNYGPEGQGDHGGARNDFAIERTTIAGEAVATRQDFDLLGRRLKLTDAKNNLWTWTYDSLDRVRSQMDPDSGSRTFVHNDTVRTQTETDALGRGLTLSYDTLGRVIGKTSGVGHGDSSPMASRAAASRTGAA